MSLFTDLKEVLTPYAQRIKNLKADLGALTKPQRLADGTDLDTVLTPGVYMLYANNSYLHKPTADSEHGILEVLHEDFGDNTGRTFQRLTYTYKAGRTNIEIWVRTYSVLTSTWSVWISETEDLSRKLMLLRADLDAQISDLGDAICACLNNVAFENTGDGKQLIETIRRISHGSPVSLTASFNPGSNVIYGYYTLASLKKYLTVTARYSNGSTQTVTDYTLSGNLESEISTITVTYNGVTTTFNVNVNIGRALTASDVVNNGGFNGLTVDNDGSIKFSSAETFSILTFPNITHISFILTPKVGSPMGCWIPYKSITNNSQYYCNDGASFFKFTKSGSKYNATQVSGVGTVTNDSSAQSGSINRAGMKIDGQTVHYYYRGQHVYTTNANILGLWQSNIHYGNITKVRVYEEV